VIISEKPRTAAEVRRAAERWYQAQVDRLSQCMGSLWPAHREWIEAYLAEEIRQRLIETGWRPKA
jgi:hypothetical protein